MRQTCQSGNIALTGVKINNYMQTAAGIHTVDNISTIYCIYSLECSWIQAFELSEILKRFLLFLTIPPFPLFSNQKMSPLNTRCFPILSSKTPLPNIPRSAPLGALWLWFRSYPAQHSSRHKPFPKRQHPATTKAATKKSFHWLFLGDPIGWLESR